MLVKVPGPWGYTHSPFWPCLSWGISPHLTMAQDLISAQPRATRPCPVSCGRVKSAQICLSLFCLTADFCKILPGNQFSFNLADMMSNVLIIHKYVQFSSRKKKRLQEVDWKATLFLNKPSCPRLLNSPTGQLHSAWEDLQPRLFCFLRTESQKTACANLLIQSA